MDPIVKALAESTEAKRGMRFWLPCKCNVPGMAEFDLPTPFPGDPPEWTVDPRISSDRAEAREHADLVKKMNEKHAWPRGTSFRVGSLELPRLPGVGAIRIEGELYTDDKSVVHALMNGNLPRLRFNPQDAIDLDILTVEEVRAMPAGFQVHEKPGAGEKAER
jgi:hypothetical protein